MYREIYLTDRQTDRQTDGQTGDLKYDFES